MSDNFENIDLDSPELENSPKALRDAYKALQRKSQEIAQERDTYRSKLNESALSPVLTGFRNPERVKGDILRDGIDPLDAAAVSSWMERNSGDYARGESAPVAPAQAQQASPAADLAAGYAQLDGSTAFAETPSTDRHAAVFSKITPEMDANDVKRLFAEHGI